LFVAAVLNVQVENVGDSSVRVSWDSLSNIPEVTGYRVYYSQLGRQAGEMSVDITDPSQDFVIVDNLESSVRYQFQVVVFAMLFGMEFVSNGSVVDLFTPSSDGCEGIVNRSTDKIHVNYNTVILLNFCYSITTSIHCCSNLLPHLVSV
jgi:hypothetical protein